MLNPSNWWTLGNQPEPYVTKNIEPIYDNSKHIATKSTYRYIGEYLPLGLENGLKADLNKSDSIKFDILSFFNSFSNLFSSDNGEKCILSEISVDQNKGFGIIPYTVTCDCYKFLSGEGIVSVSNALDFSENEDKTISINHNVSIKYLNINSDNFEIAKSFARNLTGNVNDWKFANYSDFQDPIVLSSRESANPSNGTYDISNQYLISKDGNELKSPVIRSSAVIQSGFENSTISLKGNIFTGNKNFDIDDLATYINGYNAPNDFKLIGGTINNNDFEKTFDFDLLYSNDKRISENGNLRNQSIAINIDFITSSKQITYESMVQNLVAIDKNSLENDLIKDFTQAKGAASLFEINNAFAIGNITGYSTGEITYAEKLENSLRITGENGILKYYDLSISIDATPALYQASYVPILSGKGSYYVENLDFKNRGRASLSVQGKATKESIDKVNAQELFKLVETYKNQFTKDAVVLNDELSVDRQAFSFRYTMELSYEDDSFAKENKISS